MTDILLAVWLGFTGFCVWSIQRALWQIANLLRDIALHRDL